MNSPALAVADAMLVHGPGVCDIESLSRVMSACLSKRIYRSLHRVCPMASKSVAPVLAICIALSGVIRWDAVRSNGVRWDAAAAASSSDKPTVLAAAHGCLWNCTTLFLAAANWLVAVAVPAWDIS